MRGPFGLATIVFALGLYVAAETIAWPRKFEIDRVLTVSRRRNLKNETNAGHGVDVAVLCAQARPWQ